MDAHVFPQDIFDDRTGTKVRREGGLTKLEWFTLELMKSGYTMDTAYDFAVRLIAFLATKESLAKRGADASG